MTTGLQYEGYSIHVHPPYDHLDYTQTQVKLPFPSHNGDIVLN